MLDGPRFLLSALSKATGYGLLALASFSCASVQEPRASKPGYSQLGCAPSAGYSGMTLLEPDRYLVVHDSKAHEEGPRLGLLEVIAKGEYRCSTLEVSDWKHSEGRSNDLESACSLSQRSGEFLVSESGYWHKKYGRLFHLRISGKTAEVIHAYKLPFLADNTEEKEGDNFEGMACVRQEDGRYLVLLGERGGSAIYKNGLLRWGMFDPQGNSVEWIKNSRSIEVVAPGEWPPGASKRDISDLYVDSTGILWSSAAADADKNGPFRSVVFQVGRVINDITRPVDIPGPFTTAWILDGLKVEALGAQAQAVPGSSLSIGTEDENYGGVWRPLFPTVSIPKQSSNTTTAPDGWRRR